MSKPYRISEVDVYLDSGITVRANVESFDAIKMLISDLEAAQLGSFSQLEEPEVKAHQDDGPSEDPILRIETRAGLSAGALEKVIAVKNKTPQLLRPGLFANVTDATVVLIYAIEALGKSIISREEFKDVFELQNIKSGIELRHMLANLRVAGYLDKKIYEKSKGISLTAKGESKAIEVLKATVAD